MDQLDHSDLNVHGYNINTNHFVPLFESDKLLGTNPSTKPMKNPVIVLIEDEDKKKTKEIRTRTMKKMNITGERIRRQNKKNLTVTMN